MRDFKSAAKSVWYHSKIMARGFTRVLYGAGTAGLIALAIYGYVMIPSEGGYAAVCDFIGATATIMTALCCMYAQGAAKKKGAKR